MFSGARIWMYMRSPVNDIVRVPELALHVQRRLLNSWWLDLQKHMRMIQVHHALENQSRVNLKRSWDYWAVCRCQLYP